VSLLVPDTSVFIELLRRRSAAEELLGRPWRLRLSAVVLAELVRGAESRVEERYVRALARSFPPLAPSAEQWGECGRLLRRLRRERHFDARGLRAIQNDALIALTARGLGAPVFTTNAVDFELLAGHLRGLRVLVLPAAPS
jgi:predicted nucleic acid-binding protein